MSLRLSGYCTFCAGTIHFHHREERAELERLVEKAERITLHNARALVSKAIRAFLRKGRSFYFDAGRS